MAINSSQRVHKGKEQVAMPRPTQRFSIFVSSIESLKNTTSLAWQFIVNKIAEAASNQNFISRSRNFRVQDKDYRSKKLELCGLACNLSTDLKSSLIRRKEIAKYIQ